MACFFIATSYNKSSESRYFISLGNELAKRGHKVCIVVDGQKFGVENAAVNPAFFTWRSKRPTKLADAKFFHKLTQQYRPDCIISNFASTNICTLIGWIYQVPLRVTWYHTIAKAIDIDGNASSGLKNALYRLRKRFIYLLATNIIANSQASKADVQDIYKISKEKLAVLPYLIDDPMLSGSEVDFEKIICVGRLAACKGQETLIRAIPKLKEVFPSIAVKFIGDGNQRQRYENLAKSLKVDTACEFVGNLSPDEVYREMASAAVCVSPSLAEAFGLVNVEAQSVGTPVVASNVNGISEVMLDGETGFLIPPSNSEELASKVLLLLEQKDLRNKMGTRAREHFLNTFSTKNLNRQAETLERMLNSS